MASVDCGLGRMRNSVGDRDRVILESVDFFLAWKFREGERLFLTWKFAEQARHCGSQKACLQKCVCEHLSPGFETSGKSVTKKEPQKTPKNGVKRVLWCH